MSIIEKLGFTPKPWEVFENKVRGKKHSIISRIVKGERYTDICEITFPWRKSDLKLIATTPEMLEALIILVKEQENIPAQFSDDTAYIDGKKVIEKATGKTWGKIKELINE